MTDQTNRLTLLPCPDSPDMSASRPQESDLPQKTAAALGRSAVDAASTGQYVTRAGLQIDWNRYVQAACSAKRSIRPADPLPAGERIHFPATGY